MRLVSLRPRAAEPNEFPLGQLALFARGTYLDTRVIQIIEPFRDIRFLSSFSPCFALRSLCPLPALPELRELSFVSRFAAERHKERRTRSEVSTKYEALGLQRTSVLIFRCARRHRVLEPEQTLAHSLLKSNGQGMALLAGD